ncbi:MAG TPA: class I SAM-dependent methyltransferase [Thermoplasmata archaeon]|nr:class I SAM-dependent methyltransferase [Thermoplasmata archaeon]
MSIGIWLAEWLSVRKRRTDLDAFRDLIAPEPAINLLDLGGGAGAATERFASGCGEIVVLEPNAKRVAFGRRRRPGIRFLEGRAQAIPFPDNSFDRVTSVVAFHHMENPDQVLDEIHRVLRPGGRIALFEMLPAEAPGALSRWLAACHGDHLQFHHPEELKAKLEARAFRSVTTRPGIRGFSVTGFREADQGGSNGR